MKIPKNIFTSLAGSNHILQNGSIVVTTFWCTFWLFDKRWTSLPDNVVFKNKCDFTASPFTTIPESTTFLGSVCVGSMSKIEKLPVLNIGGTLTIQGELELLDGTYIHQYIESEYSSKYFSYNNMFIRGYLIDGNILS